LSALEFHTRNSLSLLHNTSNPTQTDILIVQLSERHTDAHASVTLLNMHYIMFMHNASKVS